MPAPTNISALTALDFGPLPASISQNVHDAGTTYTVWYKYTAQPGEIVIGVFGWGGGGSYEPMVVVYTGPAAAPVEYLTGFYGYNVPIQVPVTPGETYYFEFQTSSPSVTPAVLAIEVERAPAQPFQPGDILITDFTEGYPTAVVDKDSGAVKAFLPIVATDFGDITPAGIVAVQNGPDPTKLELYDAHLAHLISVAGVFGGGSPSWLNNLRRQAGGTTFWAGTSQAATNATVRTISDAGVIGGTTWVLGTNSRSLKGLATNPAATVAYYYQAANSAVHRWDLALDIAMADLVADVAGYGSQKDGICVLADGTILVSYIDQSNPRNDEVRAYDDAGTLLNTHTLPTGSSLDRCATATDDPTSFWVWSFPNSSTARFERLRTTDFVVLETLDVTLFNQGVSEETPNPDPERFGVSNSCPLIVLRTASAAPSVTTVTPTYPTCGSDLPQRITLTGEDFPDDPVVTATGPGGAVAVTVISATATEIVIELPLTVCGEWCFSVEGSNEVCVLTARQFDIRRERIFPFPFDRSLWLYVGRLELVIQAGMGNALPPGVDPQIDISFSSDGGVTWGAVTRISAGKIGEYELRPALNGIGKMRNGVCQIVVSDPILWFILDALIDVEPSIN